MTTPEGTPVRQVDQAQAVMHQMDELQARGAFPISFGDSDVLLAALRSVAELWEVIASLRARGIVTDHDLALASARRQVSEARAALVRTPEGGHEEAAYHAAQTQLASLERQAERDTVPGRPGALGERP